MGAATEDDNLPHTIRLLRSGNVAAGSHRGEPALIGPRPAASSRAAAVSHRPGSPMALCVLPASAVSSTALTWVDGAAASSPATTAAATPAAAAAPSTAPTTFPPKDVAS